MVFPQGFWFSSLGVRPRRNILASLQVRLTLLAVGPALENLVYGK